MAPQKSPAFQFYPKDFAVGTATMSLQEVGAYMRLLCYSWDAGSVPNDANERARILGCSKAQEVMLWNKVGKKFTLRDDVYINPRMEEERQKQSEYRRRQSDRGKASAAARHQPDGNAGSTSVEPSAVESRLQPEANSSSSSSSTLKKEQEQERPLPPARPLISGESSPMGWWKIHGSHIDGFCDWVCLPEFLFAEFCRKSGQSDRQDGGKTYVRGWATTVRDRWSGPAGDNLKFWRARWSESHPESAAAPAKKPFSVQDALDREAARKAGKAS